MTYQFLTPIAMNGLEIRDVKAEAVGALPTADVTQTGRFLYHAGYLKYCDGFNWYTVAKDGASQPPNGPASGDLDGFYPNPTLRIENIYDEDISPTAEIDQAKIANLIYDLSNRVNNTRNLIAGNGLTGGGDLTADRTFNVAVTGSGLTVAADAIALDTTYLDGRYINTAGDTMTGLLVLSGNPVGPLDAAPKQYVDLATQGFAFKNAVRLVSTANITLSGLTALDGVTPIANDRVLVTAQTTASQNGIYTAQSGAWVRAGDMDSNGELTDGALVPVAEGTANADSHWICTAISPAPWVVGTSTSTWTRFSSLSDLIAGNGLTKTGNTINFVGDANLNVAADAVSVLSAPKWTTPRSITLTGDCTGTIASVDGSANISIATTVTGGATFARKYSADVPAGTACTITHNLNTRDIGVEVYRNSAPWDTVLCDVERPDLNNVTLRFAVAVTASQYRVAVRG